VPAVSGKGGPRRGAGRKPTEGEGQTRRNKVAFMLGDEDFEKLSKLAAKQDLPAGAAAWAIFVKALRRLK
jgi:hypothetical protein